MPPPKASPGERAAPDAATLLEQATTADAPDEVRVHLFSRVDDGFAAEVLKVTEALASDFAVSARTYAAGITELTIVPYSAGRTPSPYEASVTPIADVPRLREILGILEGDGDLPSFTPGDAARHVVFYVVSLRLDDAWTHAVRKKSGATLRLARSRRIAALFTNQLFDRFEAEPLMFDSTYDALVIDPHVVMTSQRNFEIALDFLELARKEVESTLTAMTSELPIKNRDEFLSAASSDINMLAKVRSIAEKMRRDPNYAKAMTLGRLKEFVKTRPGIQLDIEIVNGQEALVFHTDVQRRWRLLKLLDDDYLHSELTSHDYEVNSKDMLAP
jgi:hypothetical protein